ncbi:MAG TPA: SIS domain-containing protein, partial [Anaerolineaceae bacterium]|nr:SIS domain-containing protein [Anaerolineaceae bacterium]
RQNGRAVIWMMGAHVIKCGLGPLLIDLMEKGVITHIAGNGAVSIHDLELALIGETSEDVATSIEDGSFGMAEETGAIIHRALRRGALDGMGYGEALGRLIAEEELPHCEVSVLYHAYRLGVPATIHVTMGADIIHQHPDCDFGILGEATGTDFKVFCASVAGLDHGVFLNFGSAVTGAEVFLKALSIVRNLGYPAAQFTTGNFDLISLGRDYHSSVGKEEPTYYYRPRKNIVNRPVSMGGQGYHVQGNHLETVPTLHRAVTERLAGLNLSPDEARIPTGGLEAVGARIRQRSSLAAEAFASLTDCHPQLKDAAPALGRAYLAIAQSLERGGSLFLAGNGGSLSDALHISGELLKSFGRPRPLTGAERASLGGSSLANHLERGLRAVALGANPVIASAVDNDFAERSLAVAQELNALARSGDVFLGISTSGKARNLCLAAELARSKGLTTVLLTGPNPSLLAAQVDVAIHAPGERTDRIQESHILLYHCLCDMLERDFFGS